MIHPIFKMLLRRPDLLAEHTANYVGLIKSEAASLGTAYAVKAAGAIAAFVALLLALGLTGVAIMLGVLEGSFHWILVAVPGVAWLLAGLGAMLALKSPTREAVEELKDEVAIDVSMLRLIRENQNG